MPAARHSFHGGARATVTEPHAGAPLNIRAALESIRRSAVRTLLRLTAQQNGRTARSAPTRPGTADLAVRSRNSAWNFSRLGEADAGCLLSRRRRLRIVSKQTTGWSVSALSRNAPVEKQMLDARDRNAALAARCLLTSALLPLEECADGCNRRRWLLFHQPVPGIGDCGEGDVGGNETQIIGHCLSE
jgi:hypothetical protein